MRLVAFLRSLWRDLRLQAAVLYWAMPLAVRSGTGRLHIFRDVPNDVTMQYAMHCHDDDIRGEAMREMELRVRQLALQIEASFRKLEEIALSAAEQQRV